MKTNAICEQVFKMYSENANRYQKDFMKIDNKLILESRFKID